MDKSKIYKIGTYKDDWCTPKNVVDYFGPFDLDPATTKEQAERLGIPNYYTIETNGLDKSWWGRVWLNPPFSNKTEWIKKAREELDNPFVKEIYILLPMGVCTTLWHQYILGKSIIYIPPNRIAFEGKDTKKQSPAFESVIIKLTKESNNTYIILEKGVW